MDAKCSICGIHACEKGLDDNFPAFCPMYDEELYKKAIEIVTSDKYEKFYKTSTKIEKDGYAVWPRVKETMVLIDRMKFKKVGLAFCGGFIKEARILSQIFKDNNIELVSAMCKTGGIDKTRVGIEEENKCSPNEYEPMCNPVAQAMILNKAKTDFNIVMGLCVGHDSLFYKHSDALCKTLAVKDRVTGHNPCVALYCYDGYFQGRLDLDK